MTRELEIYCTNLQRHISFTGGETLADILDRIAHEIPFRPICARVNNKTEGLQYPVYAPKEVEFLPVTSASGNRLYVRSLCMMLYKAVSTCYPEARLSICHSISKGYFCRLIGLTVTDEVVRTLKAEMRRLVELDLPFERHEQLTREVKEIFEAQHLHDKVQLIDTLHDLYTIYYTLDGLADSYYGDLAPSTSHLQVFDLLPYHDGMLLLGCDTADASTTPEPISQEKMFKAFTEYLDFNRIIGVCNVGELNNATLHNHSSELINVAEALHDKKISGIADDIARRYREGGARIVLISGPSSSGKTTFTKRLAIYLMTNLLQPKMISLDNYFVDRHLTPRDHTGDYDFESLYALDLDLFNQHLKALIAGETVELPTYNFEMGTRQFRGNTLKLDHNSILLIEGIHGLNPELTAHIPDNMKYRIYVSALTTLSIDDHNWVPTTDNRLLRRIIRDHKYRGTSALDTIRRWPSVRRGEERWIFPYQENADSTFNSSLIFELAVMRSYGEDLLRAIPNDTPEYAEAYRLRKFLSYFNPIDGRDMPSTSLLREFLGGSSFHY